MKENAGRRPRKKTVLCEKCGQLFSAQGHAVHSKNCKGKKEDTEETIAVETKAEEAVRKISEWPADVVRPVIQIRERRASDKLIEKLTEHLPDLITMGTTLVAAIGEAVNAAKNEPINTMASYEVEEVPKVEPVEEFNPWI